MQNREDIYKMVRESASMYNPIAASIDNTPENLKQIRNLQESHATKRKDSFFGASRDSMMTGL
jgi:hypothetical protein